jgi:hypothetical protein
MRRLSLSAIVLHFLVAAPSQQTVVLPRTSNLSLPFFFAEYGCTGWVRVQNVFYVDPGASGTAVGTALRRHFPGPNSFDMPSQTVELELGMGHSRRDPGTASMRFSDNYDVDFMTVVRRRVFSFPRVPGQTQGPYPFSFRMPFDTPFSLNANRWALWEARIYSTSSTSCGTWDFMPDAAGLDPGPPYPITSIGQNCPAQSPENHLFVGRQHLGLRSQLVFNPEFAAAPDDAPVLFVGSRSDSWLGIPLPLDLTPIGAANCFVNISLDIVWPGAMTLGRSGTATMFMFEIPNNTRLLGRDVLFQGARFGSPSNPARIVTSQGVHTRIGPVLPFEGAIIYSARDNWPSNQDFGQKILLSYVTELSLR